MAAERRTAALRYRPRVESRLHFYLGLYLLFFTWLFAFTGLCSTTSGGSSLSSGRIGFRARPNKPSDRSRQPHDIDRAREVMRQLGIAGEVQWPATQPPDGPLTFQVSRPGLIVDIKADLRRRSRNGATNATERVGRDAGAAHVHGCSRGRLPEPPRLDGDDRLGAVDGRSRCRA